MGYTHYWNGKIPQSKFDKLRIASEKVIGFSDASVLWESEETDKPPELTSDLIRFNGIEDDGHETFCLEQSNTEGFCKTAQKPYDEIVTAILCLAKHYAKSFEVRSDGKSIEWKNGLALARLVEPDCQIPSGVGA